MIRDVVVLARPGVSLAVGLVSLAGHVLAEGALFGGGMLTLAGSAALAGAVSALNQIQERGRDRLMARTGNRPLAAGRMGTGVAWLVFFVLLAVSALCLRPGLGLGVWPVLLLVLGLYNGLYTCLKPVTAWAMIPGAMCGALPVWVGWLAGGGAALALTPIFFVTLAFLWQMPHFWMLAEANAGDYAAAGFPVPANTFSDLSRRTIPRLWALALAALAGMAPLFGLLAQPFQSYALATLCPAYAVTVFLARSQRLRQASDAFMAAMLFLAVAERLAG